jgi:hypothetical protein
LFSSSRRLSPGTGKALSGVELYEEAAEKLNWRESQQVFSGEHESNSHSGCTYMTMILRCQAFFEEFVVLKSTENSLQMVS